MLAIHADDVFLSQDEYVGWQSQLNVAIDPSPSSPRIGDVGGNHSGESMYWSRLRYAM
jgi:hypothetical protein